MIKLAQFGAMVAAVVFVATACSGNNTPSETAAPTKAKQESIGASATAEPSTPPHSGAPSVSSPLPSSVLDGDPCGDALTPERVEQAIGVPDTGERRTDAGLGPSCSWGNIETGGGVSVGYDIETGQGLSLDYANTKPRAIEWTELNVRNFPAVAYTTPSGIPDVTCDMSVGLADNRSITVNLTLGRNKQGKVKPCDIVPQIADLVVVSLEEKARG